MAYEMMKKRLNKVGITERQPLTLAYLLERFDREENGEIVMPDPRITAGMLEPLMVKPRESSRPEGRARRNSGKNPSRTSKKEVNDNDFT